MTPEEKVRALPLWRGLRSVAVLSGGRSNASFKVIDATGTYVARVGEDYPFHQVSRAREATASRAAFAAGLSPEVMWTEPGITVVRYLAARTYGGLDVRVNAAACLDLVGRCHRDMGKLISGQGAIFWGFQVLRDYAHSLRDAAHRHVPDIARWMKIVDDLEAAQVPLPVIFGHHDLLPANFMDDGKRLWLIDWEYGAFGTAMFDLANIATNASFEAAAETDLLAGYFGRGPDQALLRSFYAMKVASALREAVWGMVSEIHLNLPDVDYVAYAADYLGRFEKAHAEYRRNFG